MLFVGREKELTQYQQFLQGDAEQPWLMIITGMESIGKSALLKQMRNQCPSDIPYLYLDFANQAFQANQVFHINILEKIAAAVSDLCDEQRYQNFERQLDKAYEYINELSIKTARSPQTLSITASDHSSVTQSRITNLANEQINLGLSRQIDKLKTELRRMLQTFKSDYLLLLLDNVEWLGEHFHNELYVDLARQRADRWLLNTLLPELYDYLQPHRCFVIMTSRVPPLISAIHRDYQLPVKLDTLSEHDLIKYLADSGLPVELQQKVSTLTQGHTLCLSLFKDVYQEYLINSAPANSGSSTLEASPHVTGGNSFDETFTSIAAMFYERAWQQFVYSEIIQRLHTPFNELMQYCVVTNCFNLPLLRHIFPELLKEEQAVQQFEQFIQYPSILFQPEHRCYRLHPLLCNIIVPHLESREPEVLRQYRLRLIGYQDVSGTI